MSILMLEVAESIVAQWSKSSNKFAPPVILTRNALASRLQTAWDNISLISRGKAKKADKIRWEAKLDKLLDLTVCQCEISICHGPPTKTCPLPGKKECMGHITCHCKKELKLPILELKWIYYKRIKIGEKSGMGMVAGDMVETRRQVKAQNRVAEEQTVKILRRIVSLNCQTSLLLLYQEIYFVLTLYYQRFLLMRRKLPGKRVPGGKKLEREISLQFQVLLKHPLGNVNYHISA